MLGFCTAVLRENMLEVQLFFTYAKHFYLGLLEHLFNRESPGKPV